MDLGATISFNSLILVLSLPSSNSASIPTSAVSNLATMSRNDSFIGPMEDTSFVSSNPYHFHTINSDVFTNFVTSWPHGGSQMPAGSAPNSTWPRDCSFPAPRTPPEHSSDSDEEPELGLDGKRHVEMSERADAVYVMDTSQWSSFARFPSESDTADSCNEMRIYLKRRLPADYITDEYGKVVSIGEIDPHHLATLQGKVWKEYAQHRGANYSKSLVARCAKIEDQWWAKECKSIAEELEANKVFVLRDRTAPDCCNPLCAKVHTEANISMEPRAAFIEPLITWEILESIDHMKLFTGKILCFTRNEDKYNDYLNLKKFLKSKEQKQYCIPCLENMFERLTIAWAILESLAADEANNSPTASPVLSRFSSMIIKPRNEGGETSTDPAPESQLSRPSEDSSSSSSSDSDTGPQNVIQLDGAFDDAITEQLDTGPLPEPAINPDSAPGPSNFPVARLKVAVPTHLTAGPKSGDSERFTSGLNDPALSSAALTPQSWAAVEPFNHRTELNPAEISNQPYLVDNVMRDELLETALDTAAVSAQQRNFFSYCHLRTPHKISFSAPADSSPVSEDSVILSPDMSGPTGSPNIPLLPTSSKPELRARRTPNSSLIAMKALKGLAKAPKKTDVANEFDDGLEREKRAIQDITARMVREHETGLAINGPEEQISAPALHEIPGKHIISQILCGEIEYVSEIDNASQNIRGVLQAQSTQVQSASARRRVTPQADIRAARASPIPPRHMQYAGNRMTDLSCFNARVWTNWVCPACRWRVDTLKRAPELNSKVIHSKEEIVGALSLAGGAVGVPNPYGLASRTDQVDDIEVDE
ncbi:hypothetical protein K469DRAFT_774117 [Zopfia rhizophila CBS 207.26]|uniref:Uncharacterized protein n=1 Tax=Zopfia rhizophila CBS 207.26 TaxID=1314779 RepID=A0A6A6ESM0_9PEZI|nr:hypothetical protein K469DRAFT_774117 [Zopfia rhizophila CBS 207.26]